MKWAMGDGRWAMGDGREALSNVEYRHPDKIFMDIQLPGENGLEVKLHSEEVHGWLRRKMLTPRWSGSNHSTVGIV